MTQQTISQLENNLKATLQNELISHPFSEIYTYSVLPPGKLFRPLLAYGTYQIYSDQNDAKDALTNPKSNISLFCSALEVHHTYTLVHDDMPCMDDDEMRRGRLSTHKKFGQWQALLAGDGLLNISYALLSKIKHPQSIDLLRLSSWMLGPRGLIHGQCLDLSEEMRESFQKLKWTHQLKTARLIQLALLGGVILADVKDIKVYKSLRRFGEGLGLTFQLLDDLTEICEPELSPHEIKVNPWIRFYEESLTTTQKELEVLLAQDELCQKLKLAGYFQKIEKKIASSQELIEQHLRKNKEASLGPVMLLLQRLSKL